MRIAVGLVVTAVVGAAAIYAFSERHSPPLEPSMPFVQTMQVSSLAKSSAGVVAGGEQGHIFYSNDEAKTWQQASLPTPLRYAQINEITFADANEGVASAHEGVLMHTTDGGKSWAEIHFNKDDDSAIQSAAKLPDGQWLVVGAFGKAMRTADLGKTWEQIRFEGLNDRHLNKIIHSADAQQWMILGEAGTVLKSSDGGNSWNTVVPFYNGSFYGGVHLGGDRWLVYGMRGNAYYTMDGGLTWGKSIVPHNFSLLGHALDKSGAIYLVGLSGTIIRSSDSGLSFEEVRRGPQSAVLALEALSDGSWLAGTEHGIRHYSADFKLDSELAAAAAKPQTAQEEQTGAAE